MPNAEFVDLVGHLGRDPERVNRRDSDILAGARLTVAVGHPRKDKQTGEWVDDWTNWWRVMVWGDGAIPLLAGLSKGDLVRVRASKVKATTWTDRDGNARAQLEASAFNGDVSRVFWRKQGDAAAAPTSRSPAGAGSSGSAQAGSLREEADFGEFPLDVSDVPGPGDDVDIPF